MTNSDELVKRLRDRRVCSPAQNSCRNDLAMEEAANRIEALEAELAFYKGFHDGVCKNGTHVIVPVEPTIDMIEAGEQAIVDSGIYETEQAENAYRAMIKAAQEQPK